MKKTLPACVYPCGIKYTVRLEHMDTDEYGETAGFEKLIKINADPKKTKDHHRTLFHEFIHGVFHSTGLAEMMRSQGGDLEEAIVVALEEHLFRLIDETQLGRKP
mgnify:FL=1